MLPLNVVFLLSLETQHLSSMHRRTGSVVQGEGVERGWGLLPKYFLHCLPENGLLRNPRGAPAPQPPCPRLVRLCLHLGKPTCFFYVDCLVSHPHKISPPWTYSEHVCLAQMSEPEYRKLQKQGVMPQDSKQTKETITTTGMNVADHSCCNMMYICQFAKRL